MMLITPERTTGRHIVLDLHRLGYDYYEALHNFFHLNRQPHEVLRWAAMEVYRSTLTDLVHSVCDDDIQQQLMDVPDQEGLGQVIEAIDYIDFEILSQICKVHISQIYVCIRRQIGDYGRRTDRFILQHLQMDLVVVTELLSVEDLQSGIPY